MATITESSKGKTLELTPVERVRLAAKVDGQLKRLGYTIPQAARATTLSSATIRMRLRDTGEGPGTRIALWTWVALCDGLQLDAAELAESMGVTIEASDLATATHALAVRRRRMGGEAAARPPGAGRRETDGQSDGAGSSLEQRIDKALQERIDAVVERRLAELL